jgi:hypothetical protein
LIFGNSSQSGGSTASIRGERKTSNYGTELTFYTNEGGSAGNGSERMRITSGGLVGIGTSAPARKLNVQGNDDGTLQIRMQGSAATDSYCEIGRESLSTGDFRVNVCRSGTVINALKISDTTGAATFSSTLGINGVSDNIKSGTYTPTLSSIYNVTSSTAFVCQYMRVGNVVTVSGVINVTATATNTWTRISMTLPISSNFDFSYRAGGGGGANSTNNVCVILAGASTSVVYLDAFPNSTNSLSYYFSYTYQII